MPAGAEPPNPCLFVLNDYDNLFSGEGNENVCVKLPER